MLYEIRESNADLARRLDKVERRNSTPINSQSHSPGQPASPQLGPSHQPQQLGIPTHLRDPLILSRMGQPHLHSHPPLALAHDLAQTQYIHDFPQNKPGGFYFLKFSYQTKQITILECLRHSVDVLQVCDTI